MSRTSTKRPVDPATVEHVGDGEAAIIRVSGLVDERFAGFGDIGPVKCVVIDTSTITRMTSFGVRQWIKSVEPFPKLGIDVYLLGCPTFFVDQLNMVLSFAGGAKIITAVAPYNCTDCGAESAETIDVLAERASLIKGAADRTCSKCGGKLELDEPPETYFAFAAKMAAQTLHPAAARLLAANKLYNAHRSDGVAEKPARVIKLVHGSVTYFRIIGTIGSLFRPRPFLVGAEGEVVIDLAEVERFDPAAQREWRRMIKTLAGQVPSVTLVDVDDTFLAAVGDSVTLARNVIVTTVRVPYYCPDCERTSRTSIDLERMGWPPRFPSQVCSTCGGTIESQLSADAMQPLRKASTTAPPASGKVIAQRDELLSRAVTDARVAQARDSSPAVLDADATILGKYKIVRRIDAGGMAEVFLANQVGIGGFEKPVALKRIQRKLLESRHMAIDMFLNEAKIAGRLIHPNIVQVLDVGEEVGALYLAMDYVHGRDLRNVVKKLQQTQDKLPLGVACKIIRDVASALDHAYWSNDNMTGKRLSVVHRDVSPHNIMLGYDGTVKLLDFGVAASAVTEHSEQIIVGKWQYMSPEATTNETVDHRSDLFSLGVILYLLCSGQIPFNAKEPRAIVRKIRAGEYIPLHELLPVPDELGRLVARMLASRPDDRPERGKDVVDELDRLVARHQGLDCSSAEIAELLTTLFPESTATAQNAIALQRVSTNDISPMSITPTTSSSRTSGRIDVSQTFKRTTATSLAMQTPIPRTITQQPSRPAVLPHAPVQRSSARAWVLFLLLLLVAAGAGAWYEYQHNYFGWFH